MFRPWAALRASVAANQYHGLGCATGSGCTVNGRNEGRCSEPVDPCQRRYKVSTRALLDDYVSEARSWDEDRVANQARRQRTAWVVAAAGWLCAVACAGALLLLMPLKRVEPFVVRVDNTTGIVDVVPVYAGHAPMDQAVTRYFLAHYINTCERFNFATAESDYEECGAFHSAKRNQYWYALWALANPASPLNVHRDGTAVRVTVTSITFLDRGDGLADLAQVRYLKAEQQDSGVPKAVTHWIATVRYGYVSPATDPRIRRWNPLGFKVEELVSEPEAEIQTASTVGESPGSRSAP
jgi:type IV secretion system protein VirB8